MTELHWKTLAIAIKMLAKEIHKLEKECDEYDGPELPDMQELLLDYTRAAADLKQAYLDVYTPNSNLPEYSAMVAA